MNANIYDVNCTMPKLEGWDTEKKWTFMYSSRNILLLRSVRAHVYKAFIMRLVCGPRSFSIHLSFSPFVQFHSKPQRERISVCESKQRVRRVKENLHYTSETFSFEFLNSKNFKTTFLNKFVDTLYKTTFFLLFFFCSLFDFINAAEWLGAIFLD